MTCEPSEQRITVEIPNVGLEVSPYNVDFRRERGKFDYFNANFHADVGNYIQDSVISPNGPLSYLQKVYVKMEGERVYPMVFDPGKVSFNRGSTTIELLDPIADLGHSFTDIKRESTTGKEILEEIFNHYQDSVEDPILTNLLFPNSIDPENRYVTVAGSDVSPSDNADSFSETAPGWRGTSDRVLRLFDGLTTSVELGLDFVTDIFYKDYAVDYDEMSCLEAFLDMVNRMGVDVWTKPATSGSMDLHLCVGKFESKSNVFHATPEDSNALKITDHNVSTMDEPIKQVIVRGRIIHDDKGTSLENILEAINPKEKTQDYRAHGVAQRENITRGKTVKYDVEAPIDSLAELAESRMQDLLQRGTSGDIEISPPNSGKEGSDYRNLSVGDILNVHEPREDKCKEWSQIYDNLFVITGVENNISNGAWTINMDVVDKIGKDDVPKGELRLFDVNSEEYVEPDDL